MKVLTIGHCVLYLQKLFDFIPSRLFKKCEDEQHSTLFSFSSQQRSLANLRAAKDVYYKAIITSKTAKGEISELGANIEPAFNETEAWRN